MGATQNRDHSRGTGDHKCSSARGHRRQLSARRQTVTRRLTTPPTPPNAEEEEEEHDWSSQLSEELRHAIAGMASRKRARGTDAHAWAKAEGRIIQPHEERAEAGDAELEALLKVMHTQAILRACKIDPGTLQREKIAGEDLAKHLRQLMQAYFCWCRKHWILIMVCSSALHLIHRPSRNSSCTGCRTSRQPRRLRTLL